MPRRAQVAKRQVMSHTSRDKKKLLNRVRRIRGQIDAIERALEEDADASSILHTIAAVRGAMNGLMAQIIEGHVELHVLDPHKATDAQREAGAELMEVIRAYMK